MIDLHRIQAGLDPPIERGELPEGLVVLPGHVDERTQVELARTCVDEVLATAPWTNLGALGREGVSEDERKREMRWATVGYNYDWTRREYREGWITTPMPRDIADVCLSAARDARCGQGYRAEAAIVNYYASDSRMGLHRDDAELTMEKPIVTVSLGLAGVFCIETKPPPPPPPPNERYLGGGSRTPDPDAAGSLTAVAAAAAAAAGGYADSSSPLESGSGMDPPPSSTSESESERGNSLAAILLRSGDVVVMSGASRYALHGLCYVVPDSFTPSAAGTGAEGVWPPHLASFLRSRRININVRQVEGDDADVETFAGLRRLRAARAPAVVGGVDVVSAPL